MKTGCFLSPVQPDRVIQRGESGRSGSRCNNCSTVTCPCNSAIFSAYRVSPVHSVRGNWFRDFHLWTEDLLTSQAVATRVKPIC